MQFLHIVLFALLANSLVFGVFAHGTGAPRDACSGMVPQHGNYTSGKSAPYKLTVSSGEVQGGSELTVRLEAVPLEENYFLGFMIQARSLDDEDQLGQTAIGEFVLNDENSLSAKLLDCHKSEKNVVTHKNVETQHHFVEFTWKAPVQLNTDGVVFRATVAKSYKEFYTGILSNEVRITQ